MKILIIGAGIAGLAASQQLLKHGISSIILEGREKIGGRILVDDSWGVPISLGAQWMHGTEGNPMTDMANQLKLNYVESHIRNANCYDRHRQLIAKEISSHYYDVFNEKLKQAKQYALQQNKDISLIAALDAIYDSTTGSTQEQDLYWNAISFLTIYTGAEASDLSALHWDDDVIIPGGNQFMVDTYRPIVNKLAENKTILLNTVAQEIDYDKTSVYVKTNQGMFSADKVIVTVPLGVLKNQTIRFKFDLPATKTHAIQKLKMGTLDCLALQFPKVFWPEDCNGIRVCDRNLDFTIFHNLHSYLKMPITTAWIAGSRAEQFEKNSDEEWIEKAMISLRQIFGNSIPSPDRYLIKRWSQDPLSYGSYSYLPIGASIKECEMLAEPIANKIYFAGEATHHLYPASVVGAYLSGIREAVQILS